MRAFTHAGLREGLIAPSLGFYMPYLFLRYGMPGSMASHAEPSFPFLRDVPKAALDELARRVFGSELLPLLDRGVLERIESLRGEGGRVIIASSSFGFMLAPLAEQLGIDEVVASELEFRDGATTGRLEGPPAFGEGKRAKVLAYLRTIGTDPRDCSFYTDSYRDLPLLLEVGKAVAVNPGPRLRRRAAAEGWEILMTRSRD